MKNKKSKSPILFGEPLFCSYGSEEKYFTDYLCQFSYDGRHDFVIDKDFCGIAVRLEFLNDNFNRGARRKVSVHLVDVTLRYEVASQEIRVVMNRDEYVHHSYVCFPDEANLFKAGHTYKLAVCDETAHEVLGETFIHLFDLSIGKPENWYTIVDGGVRPSWIDNLYKSLNTIHHSLYYVRFNLIQNFGFLPPYIFPELEIRLHYPDGKHVDVFFREPMCFDHEYNRYFVEVPLVTTSSVDDGIYYVEVLCMQYAIAGYVFDTHAKEILGVWFGPEIEPMNEYSPEAAKKRLTAAIPYLEAEPHIETDDLDALIDQFIYEQNKKFGIDKGERDD